MYEWTEKGGSYTKRADSVYEWTEKGGSCTKWPVFVYERGEKDGSYTKRPVFVYERGRGRADRKRDGTGRHCRFGKMRYLCKL